MQGAVVHGRWRGSGPGYCEGLGLTAIPGEDPPAVTYDIDVETRCSVHKTALVTRGVMVWLLRAASSPRDRVSTRMFLTLPILFYCGVTPAKPHEGRA